MTVETDMERSQTTSATPISERVNSKLTSLGEARLGDYIWVFMADDQVPILPEEYELLDSEERARAFRYIYRQDAESFIRCHIITRLLLGALSNTPAKDIRISRRCSRCGHPLHGKPRTVAGSNIEFSVSRRRSMVMVGVTCAGRLGVDLEPKHAAETLLASRHVWTVEDRHAFANEQCDMSSEATRRWVAKEAVGKAIGTGVIEIGSVRLPTDWERSCIVRSAGHFLEVVTMLQRGHWVASSSDRPGTAVRFESL